MSKFTTAKKACKCWLCKAPINVGDKAQWHKHESIGHGEWSGKQYTRTHWELQCAEGCGDRLLAEENQKKQMQAIKDAENTIKLLRGNGISVIEMIAHYAKQGIIVE